METQITDPKIKPCPFCGMSVDLQDPDSLYPNGTGWAFNDNLGFRTYHSAKEVPAEQWCYSLHCVVHHGGCGAEMHADSRQEAIDRWNKRSYSEE